MDSIPPWHITGEWFDNCSCAVACPCTFAQPPDNGYCDSVLFWHVARGHYGDVVLDGLSFVRVGRWEGDLWAGKVKGAGGVFIDARRRSPGRRTPAHFRRTRRRLPGAGQCALHAGPADPRRRARRHHVRYRRRSLVLGRRDRGQGQGVGEGADRADERAGEVPATGECAGLRNRPGVAARDVGQVDDLQGGRVRLSLRMDDELEQAHSVRLERTVSRRALAVRADVADERAVVAMFESVDPELGVPTALVNNAGVLEVQRRAGAPGK
jgi:hypothetical protein